MILTGEEIRRQHTLQNLTIEPFRESQLNPNSYDFRLGSEVVVYDEFELDAAKANPSSVAKIPNSGLTLSPDRIYLAAIEEMLGSNEFVPILHAKSSIARLGLFIHITAGLIDIGSHGHWTLQLHAVQPVRIYRGMLIGQVTFWRTQGEVVRYSGKYQNASTAQPSRSFEDFVDENLTAD